jgi:hypothetical protein
MAACNAWLYIAAMFHDGVRGLLLLMLCVLSWSKQRPREGDEAVLFLVQVAHQESGVTTVAEVVYSVTGKT